MSDRILGVIFDLDGLILDTETPDYLSWNEIYARYDLDLTVEAWADVVGRRDLDLYAPLRARGVDVSAVRENRHRRLAALMEEYLKPSPGFHELVNRLAQGGMRLALASNSDRIQVDRVVDRLGIRGFFDLIVTGDQVPQGKPAPDIYLLAVSRLNVLPRECVALEDSQPGIESAKAAGLYCIAVPTLFSRHQDLSRADLIISSLEEITLDVLAWLPFRSPERLPR